MKTLFSKETQSKLAFSAVVLLAFWFVTAYLNVLNHGYVTPITEPS